MKNRSYRLASGLLTLWLLSTCSARAAFDTFLQFITPTIDGEATDKGFEKAVKVYSFSLAIANTSTIGSATGGAGAGKATLSSLSIMKTLDSTSPVLFKDCAAGKHYDEVKLSMRKAGADGSVFLVYTFKTVLVQSVQWSGSAGGDNRPTESVSFAYGAVTIAYSKLDETGKPVDTVTGGWDQLKNVAIE